MDSNPRIFDSKTNTLFAASKVFQCLDIYFYLAFLCEFLSISQEIYKNLLYAHGIHPHILWEVWINIQYYFQTFLFQAIQYDINSFRYHFFHFYLVDRKPHVVAFQFRKVENIIDDAKQRGSGLIDNFQILALRLIQVGL